MNPTTQANRHSRRHAPPELAAAENLSPALLKTLSAIGLEVLVVRFQALHGSPIWNEGDIATVLEKAMQAIGKFDAEFYSPGARWLFFHVGDLGKAMQLIKSALDARGLLEITTLLHVESAAEMRVWYPATAETVQTGAESEA